MSNNSIIPTTAVVGIQAAASFILLGNAITQSFMGVPALLVDFPRPSATNTEEYNAAARKLGRAWPVFWNMGNVFFRPLSTLGIFAYGYAAYATMQAASSPLLRDLGVGNVETTSWKLYAISAACHLVTVVHSAVNMQPINEKIDRLKNIKPAGMNGEAVKVEKEVQPELAEFWARKWIRLNTVRIVMPAVAGTLALVGALKGQ
ncbi:hypothetical protein V8F20_001395 [Naviculisporaceae sp. PSN 640]